MKYVHLENGKILGWFDNKIHTNIPTPNIEVNDKVWQEAINKNANFYDEATKTFLVKDFRTEEEIQAQLERVIINKAKAEGEIYTLNDVDYQVPFMKDDADGLMQVNAAFGLGVTDTVIHFTNGVKMPLAAAEFQAFAVWFVTKRNAFFVG